MSPEVYPVVSRQQSGAPPRFGFEGRGELRLAADYTQRLRDFFGAMKLTDRFILSADRAPLDLSDALGDVRFQSQQSNRLQRALFHWRQRCHAMRAERHHAGRLNHSLQGVLEHLPLTALQRTERILAAVLQAHVAPDLLDAGFDEASCRHWQQLDIRCAVGDEPCAVARDDGGVCDWRRRRVLAGADFTAALPLQRDETRTAEVRKQFTSPCTRYRAALGICDAHARGAVFNRAPHPGGFIIEREYIGAAQDVNAFADLPGRHARLRADQDLFWD